MDSDSTSIQGLDVEDDENEDQNNNTAREIAKFKNILVVTLELTSEDDVQVFEISCKIAAMSNYLKGLPTYHDVLKNYLKVHVNTNTFLNCQMLQHQRSHQY